jgi:glycosyltransferase involved in cell wall biosynthesis
MRSEGKTGYRIGHMMPWEEIGGTEMATLRIAQGVKAHGFESVMFCRELALPTEFFREANLETATYDVEHPDLRNLRGFLYRVRNLVRELKQKRIDLIHCADVPYSSVAIVAAKLMRLPVVSHVRNRHLLPNPIDQRFLRFVNKFIFVLQNTWEGFGYKVPPRRGIVVYDGIETPSAQEEQLAVDRFNMNRDVRCEFGISDEVKIVGMVARIDQQKDYLTLAKAAQRVVGTEPRVN